MYPHDLSSLSRPPLNSACHPTQKIRETDHSAPALGGGCHLLAATLLFVNDRKPHLVDGFPSNSDDSAGDTIESTAALDLTVVESPAVDRIVPALPVRGDTAYVAEGV
jgi:hypothetical protein